MNLEGATMVSVFLFPTSLGIIESYAQKAKISQSEAANRLIIQCAKMVVTGVAEEVTEKDVFEDINRELESIDERLKRIEENVVEIHIQTFSDD